MTVTVREVIVLVGNLIHLGEPALSNAPNNLPDPSEKLIAPPRIHSSGEGKSNSTTVLTTWGESQWSVSCAPTPSPFDTHSCVASPG